MTNKELANEIALFASLFRTTVERAYGIKGNVKHELKRWSNQFINTGNSLLAQLERNINAEESATEYFDSMSYFFHEVLHQALIAEKKEEFLALVLAYNKGEVPVTYKDEVK